jgi:PIN domain nuclease of toxin-antitoxin system
VKLLLDTHVWLWLQESPERLGPALGPATDPENSLLLSAVSSWEIAIKCSMGKLELPEPVESYVAERMTISGVTGLPIQHSHALAVAGLPRHHRDPFDRLLIAQALVEQVTLVTADNQFQPYPVQLMWAG